MNLQRSMALLDIVQDAGVRVVSTLTGIRAFGATAEQLEFLSRHKDEIREAAQLQESIEAFEAASVTVFDKTGKVVLADGRRLSGEARLDLAEALDDLLGNDLDSPHFAGIAPDGRPVYQGTKREWVALWQKPYGGGLAQKVLPAHPAAPSPLGKPPTKGIVPPGWTPAEAEQWRNVARQILASDLGAGRVDRSTVLSCRIGLRGLAAAGDLDARAAMSRMEGALPSR